LFDGLLQLLGLLVIGVGLYLLLYKADLLSVVFEMAYIEGSVIVIIFCGGALMLIAVFGFVANRLAHFGLLAAVCLFVCLFVIVGRGLAYSRPQC